MNFNEFKKLIPQFTISKLNGLEAQYKLAPEIRKPYTTKIINAKQPKLAAVIALFYPNKFNETCFLLTKRASYKGTHSAQISFPGGKIDKNDGSLKNTAIRETFEEVGIQLNETSIFKEMTNVYIPPSNFLVTPFLATINLPPIFNKNHEVDTIIQISLSDFLNDSVISSTKLSTSYAKDMNVPCFVLNNYIIWGATAMMLNEIRELLKNI